VGSDDRVAGRRESSFYRRLNQLLREHGFDDFVEGQCASFYAETMGRPGVPPGIYFRLLLIGYFEGIGSERELQLDPNQRERRSVADRVGRLEH
jgi:hypothetical protein